MVLDTAGVLAMLLIGVNALSIDEMLTTALRFTRRPGGLGKLQKDLSRKVTSAGNILVKLINNGEAVRAAVAGLVF